jgi:hypothetical protein
MPRRMVLKPCDIAQSKPASLSGCNCLQIIHRQSTVRKTGIARSHIPTLDLDAGKRHVEPQISIL